MAQAQTDNWNDFTPPNQQPIDQSQDKKNSVNAWYNQYLGRNANPDEQDWWAGADNFGTVQNQIQNSDEAKKYAGAQSQPAKTPFDRNAFRDAWMSTGTDVNRQNQLLQQYGIQISPNGTATLPTGEIMDLRIGAKSGQNLAGWTGVGAVNNGVTTYFNNGTPAQSGGYSSSSTSITPASNPQSDQLYNMLLQRAQQGLNVDPNDPVIKGQSDAYNAQLDRARRNYLSDLAESAGPYASGAMLGQARQTAEAEGQQGAAFQSQLMGRELQSRRDEIQQALAQMGSMLSDEQRLALQKELGYLNDATQRYGIGTSADTARYGIDTTAQTAANRLGLDTANSAADYWLRSQGIS
jgi:hypothetical protein